MRYLDKSGKPQEKFISLTPLHSTTAEGIYEKVVAAMDGAHIPMDKMAFCCFDGGSAYAGCHAGVQSLIRQRHNPRLVYIWCRNHFLQLSRVIDRTKSVCIFIQYSQKRSAALKSAQDVLGQAFLKVVIPGDTRWLSYFNSFDRLVNRYEAIKLSLMTIANGDDSSAAEETGYVKWMTSSETYSIVVFMQKLLEKITFLSTGLQASSSSITDCIYATKATIEDIQELLVDKIIQDAFGNIEANAGVTFHDRTANHQLLKLLQSAPNIEIALQTILKSAS